MFLFETGDSLCAAEAESERVYNLIGCRAPHCDVSEFVEVGLDEEFESVAHSGKSETPDEQDEEEDEGGGGCDVDDLAGGFDT